MVLKMQRAFGRKLVNGNLISYTRHRVYSATVPNRIHLFPAAMLAAANHLSVALPCD